MMTVDRRTARWFTLAMMLVLVGGMPVYAAKDAPAQQTQGKEELSRPLKIYRDALFSGATEQTRNDAATELLMSSDENSRGILLAALSQDDNPAARMAVYKVLIDSRRWSTAPSNTEGFIDPLMKNLRSREGAEAQQVAEATMIFDYKQIAPQLKAILADKSAGVKPRLNAVYALRIRPEGEAISELIALLDDSDDSVASAASEALQEWIPLGSDKQVWRGILEDLKKKSRADIVRERLKVLELQKRDLASKLETWQKLYIASLKRIYDGMPDAAARQSFVIEQLQSEHSLVKLWGLERVREMSLSETQISADIASRVVTLVNDNDPAVRLATAKLLGLKTNVDSTAKLLAQLKVETDDSVKAELLSALGSACYYALLPGSQMKLPEDIRTETVAIASQYLQDKDPRKAAKGADVVSKLLEQNGLKGDTAGKYLEMLQQRYSSCAGDSPLRVDLLRSMARLCETGGHRAESAGLFGPLFSDAVKDGQPAVREAGFAGLVAIDKANALAVARQNNLAGDSNPAVRAQVVKLAGSVGGTEDLAWLASKIGVAGEGDGDWQAMKQIFDRSDVKVLVSWVTKLEEMGLVDKIGATDWPAFLSFVEKRAGNSDGGNLAASMRQKQAVFYRDRGEYDKAASSYRQLMDASTAKEKDIWTVSFVDMSLRAGTAEALKAVAAILGKRMETGKIGKADPVVGSIDAYLAASPGSDKIQAVLEALAGLQGGDEWKAIIDKWRSQYPITVSGTVGSGGEEKR
jgi:hypothetical protein